jgi:hypothetical protein
MLLHGEDLGNHPRGYRNRDFAPVPSRMAHPSPRPSSSPATPPPSDISMRHIQSPSPPILLRARGSETGSIFHEDVWPPPAETSRLVDPIVQASSQVDLGSIVDDIMGPADRTNRSSFAYNGDDDDDTGTDGELSPTTRIFDPPHPYHQPIALSIRTSTTSSNPGYDYSHSPSSNASQARLWTSDSTSSLPQQPYHRYSSPLRHSVDTSLGGRASDPASNRDSRLWIDRSPKRASSRFGTDSS